jgi:hypothetical protein
MIKNVIKKAVSIIIKKHPPLWNLTNVGIVYLCTGKYEMFFDDFYQSFSKRFLPGANKIFFVFTDSDRLNIKYANNHDIRFFRIEHKGWPMGTLLRNRYFHQNFDQFEGLGYLFFCNANLVCKENVYLNELGLVSQNSLCGVQHPFYFHKQPSEFIVEKTKACNAFFTAEEVERLKHYFQGCFYGGKLNAFREMVSTIYHWTEEDLKNNVIPVWFDESYLNRYFFLNPPFPLHSGYAYPGNAIIPFPRKIIMLDKHKLDDNYFKRHDTETY